MEELLRTEMLFDEFPLCLKTETGICLRNTLPGEVSGENPVVLIPEYASLIEFAQTGRSGTTGKNEISQTYTDPGIGEKAVEIGEYVDWMTLGRFPFLVASDAKYELLLEICLPKRGTWNCWFSLNGGASEEIYIDESHDPDKWFLFPVPGKFSLNKGGNILEISNLLGGKRLRKIILKRADVCLPAELKPSPLQPLRDAWVKLKGLDLCPGMIAEKIVIPYHAGDGTLPEIRLDFHGKNFPVSRLEYQNGFLSVPIHKKITGDSRTLNFSMLLKHDGKNPVMGTPVFYYFPGESAILTMRSGNARLLLEKENGNVIGGCLEGRESTPVLPLFCILPPPLVIGGDGGQPDRANALPPPEEELTELTERSLAKRFFWREENIEILLKLAPEDNGLFQADITVRNHGKSIIAAIQWPSFPPVSLTAEGSGDVMMFPRYEPELIPAPGTRGLQSEVYPCGSMNWVDLSGAGQGLFAGAPDKELTLTRFVSRPTASGTHTAISLEKQHYIHAGEEKNYRYHFGFHSGDWHEGAVLYRRIFTELFGEKLHYPEWVTDSNGIYEASLASVEANLPEIQPPPYAQLTKHHIDRVWYLGGDHLHAWGQGAMDHACPTYYLPDPERGGEEAFEKMTDAWKRAGLHIGSYFHSSAYNPFFAQADVVRSCPVSSLSPGKRPPDRVFFEANCEYSEREGKPSPPVSPDIMEKIKTHEAVIPRKYPRMCSFSRPWQDYLVFWIKEYLNRYSHCSIYHDQLGNAPQHLEFNPSLGVDGAGNGGEKMLLFLKRIKDLADASGHRDLLQIQEAVTDAFSPYAPAFTSGFHRNPEVYRYTFPDFIMYFGHGNGCWKDRMQYQMLQIAFLEGMKFDIQRIKDDGAALHWLRDPLRKWFFRAEYRHNIGVDIRNGTGSRWRCFYTDTEENHALTVSLCDVPENAVLTFDRSRYGTYEKALFFREDGTAEALPVAEGNSVVLPSCRSAVLLLCSKCSEDRSFWLQAIPAGERKLRISAMPVGTDSTPLEVRISDGEHILSVHLNFPEKTVKSPSLELTLPDSFSDRITISADHVMFPLRRFTGTIHGTYCGYPYNRKNLRFHFYEVPPEVKERILREDY